MYLKDFDFDGIINDHMVIPKFMNNKINTLGQYNITNFQVIRSNIVFFDHFSGGHKNDH